MNPTVNATTAKQTTDAFNVHGVITLPIVLLLIVIFLWLARVWIGKALSERQPDGSKVESSKRLVLFEISTAYCICSILVVFKSGIYSVQHKLIDACLILLLAGVTTLPQIVMLYRRITGKGDKDDDAEAAPVVTTETTTKTTTQNP